MDDFLALVLQYGYVVLFAFVSAEQVGLPIPAVPVLLGVGALAGLGQMSLAVALGVAVAASMPPDIIWYEIGRRRGGRVLGLICRISLEPDTCVRRSENLFMRRGWGALLIAKFFPGLSTVAPPLAGIVGIARPRFLLLDVGAALLWAGTWLALGYVFRDVLDTVVRWAARAGNGALVIAAIALVAYAAVKLYLRWAFLRRYRMARISPEDLKGRMDAGDKNLAIIDTRSTLDLAMTPFIIRGAVHIPAEEIDRRLGDIPGDRELVLYCS